MRTDILIKLIRNKLIEKRGFSMEYAENNFINHPEYENNEIKSAYDKHIVRQPDTYIPIKLFGTGSGGNSIYLKPQKTLIDVGLPYARYTEYDPYFFFDVNYVIVTHHHGDHLNPGTLLSILRNHPHIKLIMLPYMYEYITSNKYKAKYKTKKDSNGNTLYQLGQNLKPNKAKPMYEVDDNGEKIIEDLPYQEAFEHIQSKIMFATHDMTLATHDKRSFEFKPHTTKHGDIINLAIEIDDPSMGLNLLYASDLDDLNGGRSFVDYKQDQQHITGLPQDKQFNLLFLEANYDEEILNNVLSSLDPSQKDYHAKKTRAMGNLRHISEQESFKYVSRTLSDSGLFIPLHASRSFGTLFQE